MAIESGRIGPLMQLDFRDPAGKMVCHSVKDLEINEGRGTGNYHLAHIIFTDKS